MYSEHSDFGGGEQVPKKNGGGVKGSNEHTSAKSGTAASKVLRSGKTGKNSKTAAGSALSQRPDKKKS